MLSKKITSLLWGAFGAVSGYATTVCGRWLMWQHKGKTNVEIFDWVVKEDFGPNILMAIVMLGVAVLGLYVVDRLHKRGIGQIGLGLMLLLNLAFQVKVVWLDLASSTSVIALITFQPLWIGTLVGVNWLAAIVRNRFGVIAP
jgi:hypothetical protein